ncbi:MAG: hypothetical protein WC565_09535, partial [Parcubacteria group bacterium]
MQQVLFGGRPSDALNNAATEYNAVAGANTWNATESARVQCVSAPGTIDSLYVELTADPGTSPDAYRFTLRKNGSDTALTCTITADATSGSDVSHSVAVVAGDVVSIQCEALNTPSATPGAQWTMRFTSTNAAESLILGHVGCAAANTVYHGICAGGSAYSTTENDVRQVCPTAGTIKNLYVSLSIDPGTSPDAYTFTLRKNGADTALTCTIVANDTTGNDTAHTVAVVAGDVLTMSIVPVSTPSDSPRASYGFTFAPTIDGESIVMGGSSDDLNNAATEYIDLCGILNNLSAWNATETSIQQMGQVCILRKLNVLLSAQPGSGKTWTFTPRVNAASPGGGLSVAITGTDTTGSDTTNSNTLSAGDNVDLMAVPTSSPATADAYWGLVCQVPQTTAKAISGAAATAGTLPRATGRHLAGTAATVGTVGIASTWLKAIAAATAEAVGSLVRSTGRHFAGLASTVGTMRPLTVGKALEGTSDASGSVARATAKTVGLGTAEAVGTLTRGLVFMKALAIATAEAVGTVRRAIGKNLTGASATAGTVRRAIARTITGTASTVGTVPRAVTKAVAAGTVATVGSLIRGMVYTKAIATGIVSTVGTVVRQTGQVLSAAVEAVALGIRPLTVGKVPDTTVGTVGTIRPLSITRAITGTVEAIGTARRAIAKTVATAVVSTVGTIWAAAGQLVSAGAEVIASVSRRVYRNITGTVPVVATITDFLYDIVYAMNQTFRRIYAKVRITYTDPYFSAGVATSADAVGDYTYTDQAVDNVTTEEYKWFSLHRNALDGTYHPLPGDQSISVGWWGTQLSDFATRVFVPPYPTLTITHAARIVDTLLVVGDDQLNEYPVNFNVYLYSTGDVLEHTENVTGNTLVTWTKDLAVAETGIVKQVLEITKWSRGGAVSKIAQFFTTLEQVYMSEDGDIVSLNMTEQREFSGTTIPQGNMASSEITVRLNNIEGIFDPGNTASPLYGLLLNNRAITAWLGVDLIPSGVRRWYPLGTFYSRDWSAPDSEIYAEVSGQDMLARLQ